MPALAILLEQARKKTVRVWVEHSPFDLKDALKRRGYRWSPGNDGRPRSAGRRKFAGTASSANAVTDASSILWPATMSSVMPVSAVISTGIGIDGSLKACP